MKKSYLFLVVSLLIYSCKKDSSPIFKVEGTYQTDDHATLDEVKIYTKNKIITDPSVVKDYLDRNRFNNYFFQDKQIENLISVMTIKISADDSVKITIPDGTPIFTGSVVSKNSSEIILEAAKAQTTFINYDYTNQYQLGKYKMKEEFAPLSIGTGYTAQRTAWGKIPLLCNNGDCYIPLMSTAETKTTSFGGYKIIINAYNVINPNLTNIIGVNDTIVVQEKRLKLIKSN